MAKGVELGDVGGQGLRGIWGVTVGVLGSQGFGLGD